MIKKEFKQRDVQRMRNLITGKTGDKTQTQIGYEKNNEGHVEGDIWEEAGKKWTIKNGIKRALSKYTNIRKALEVPLACPCCKKPMNDYWIDVKMYRIHGMCLDCVTDMETRLKAEGKFEAYMKGIMNANKNALLDDLATAIDSWQNEQHSFVSEDGVVEDWSKVDKNTESVKELKSFIERAKEQDI